MRTALSRNSPGCGLRIEQTLMRGGTKQVLIYQKYQELLFQMRMDVNGSSSMPGTYHTAGEICDGQSFYDTTGPIHFDLLKKE